MNYQPIHFLLTALTIVSAIIPGLRQSLPASSIPYLDAVNSLTVILLGILAHLSPPVTSPAPAMPVVIPQPPPAPPSSLPPVPAPTVVASTVKQ